MYFTNEMKKDSMKQRIRVMDLYKSIMLSFLAADLNFVERSEFDSNTYFILQLSFIFYSVLNSH